MNFFFNRLWLGILGLVAAIGLGGCSIGNVWTPYPQQMASVRKHLAQGALKNANSALPGDEDSTDRVLFQLERGRIHQLKQAPEASIESWENAVQDIEAFRQKARFSISDTFSQAAAIAINDNAIPYRGSVIEKTLVHTFQAFNYLELNDLEGAQVELRRARNEQLLNETLNREAIEEARSEALQHNISKEAIDSTIQRLDDAMAQWASTSKEDFLNGYTFYVSAVIWEIAGNLESAYLDYKKALQVSPDNRVAAQSVLRLAKKLGRNHDLELFETRYQSDSPHIWSERNSARLVVLFEDNLVAAKRELKNAIYYNYRAYSLAFPFYLPPAVSQETLEVSVGNRSSLLKQQTEPICNMDKLVAMHLREQYPQILARQFARLVFKHQLQKELRDLEDKTTPFTSLYTFLTEKADLRSWLTLPSNFQVADLYLEPGETMVNWTQASSGSGEIALTLKRNKTTLLRVVRVGSRFYTQALGPF